MGYVIGQFDAKEDNMAKYLTLVKKAMGNFKRYSITRIERRGNVWVDALSKMASCPNGRNYAPIKLMWACNRKVHGLDRQTKIQPQD